MPPRNSRTITQFKGMVSSDSVANVLPNAAIECQNVVGDGGGWLQQLFQPTLLIDWSQPAQAATALAQVLALGYIPVPSANPRLLIQQGLNLLFSDYPYSSASVYTNGSLAGIISRMDFIISNGISYFSNGQDSGYALPPAPTTPLPTSSTRFQWGIQPPISAPSLIRGTCYVNGQVTIQRAGGILTITTVNPHGAVVGFPFLVDNDPLALWNINGTGMSGLYNATTVPSATVLTIAQPGLPDQGPFVRASFTSGLTATTGYQFSVSYGSSPVAHFSSVSPKSIATGPLTSQSPIILLPPSSDPQVDTSSLFRNLDGGGDWYLTNDSSNTTPGTGTVTALTSGPYAGYYLFISTTLDATLVTSGVSAPYDNGVAPTGKYLAVWLDRVMMCGISSDPTAVRYTGYDSLPIGRPQMSWCQFNNIRLGQGEAEPMGMGLLRYGGMVFFANNGLMYIYRGSLNDVTVSAPSSLSFYAEQLPYKIGLYSHFTLQSTPAGLVWLDDGFNLRVYENSGFYPPRPISSSLAGIFRRITPGSQDRVESIYINYLQRDWYILSVPLDGSTTNNCTVIVDLNPDPNRNTGAWPTTYAASGMVWIVYRDGTRHLLSTLTQLPVVPAIPSPTGYLAEIPLIANIQQGIYDDRHSLTSGVTPAPLMPDSFWRSGYFGVHDDQGIDVFSMYKLFRYTRTTGSYSTSPYITGFLVDAESSTFDRPQVQPLEMYDDFGGLNAKARAVSLLLSFPDPDASNSPQLPSTITSLALAWNITGVR